MRTEGRGGRISIAPTVKTGAHSVRSRTRRKEEVEETQA